MSPAESRPGPFALLDGLEGSRLAANVMHFGRILRSAGLPVGTGKVLDAVGAVREVGVTNRSDFYWALHAVFVNRRDQHDLFDQAFHIFWRDPKILERMMGIVMPEAEVAAPPPEPPSRRLLEALNRNDDSGADEEKERDREIELDAAMTASANELLQEMDFEDMSADEIARAKAAIARMSLPIAEIPTRRFRPDRRRIRVDMRATLRAALRSGGATIPLKWRRRATRLPPLVIVCDISGSMSRYTRMFLHFMHTLTNDRDRVHTFLFGTRLTNVTRHLRQRDIDVALTRVADSVEDWSGGTRIGESLKEFNRFWSRRVLGQGAVVLLISDGLDRDAGRGLHREIERLHKSCRRLIWLNPLLRFEGFEPRSQGIRSLLPFVDEFRPVHNLQSLEELIEALGRPSVRRREGMDKWLRMLA
ncbi:MAG: VWA domain-containing protein [Defluviicoccus sp.]|nr:VWA domain-containing protein [Defluviicoccus sp.]MDE0279009.1 VWA domain-containing protein [Defluviicoccus sp.]